jgi:1-acyl-sn-glycerol-3-phosphate acyltransferase
MINTELVPSRFFKIPTMHRPKIRIGKPMDFTAYADAGNDRDVLRWVTDEIMNAIMELSGQAYVDVYGGAAKAALEAGKPLPPSAGHRLARVVRGHQSRPQRHVSIFHRFRM